MSAISKFEVGPSKKGTRRFLFLGLALAWVLMLLTASYSVDYRALSPIGGLTVIITISYFVIKPIRSLLATHLSASTLVVLILFQGSTFPQPGPLPLWDMSLNNLSMLTNTHAWRAAFQLDLNRGVAGITPLFYRVVVPQAPVSLVVMPNIQTSSLQAKAIVSGQHLIPFETHPAILNTLPDHTLNVHRVIILSNNSKALSNFSEILLPALQVGCSLNCVANMQLEINPEYATKVAIDVLSMTTTVIKVPQIIGKSANILSTASNLLLSPGWNTKLNTNSSGTTIMGGSEFTWQSNSVRVDSGSILNGNWSVSESKHIVITQTFLPGDPSSYEHKIFDPPALNQPPTLPNYKPPALNPIYQPPAINPVLPNYQPPIINPVMPNYQPPIINPVMPNYQPPIINPVIPNYQPSIINPVIPNYQSPAINPIVPDY
jgi:hypothetical protein